MVKEARGEWVREVTMSIGKTSIVMFALDMVMMAETKELSTGAQYSGDE